MPSRSKLVLLPILLTLSGILLIFSLLGSPVLPALARYQDESKIGAAPTVVLSPTTAIVQARIHPALWSQVAPSTGSASRSQDDLIPVIIEWRSAPFEAVVENSFKSGLNDIQQRSGVIAALKENAHLQSAALQAALEQAQALGQASQVRTYWVSPIIAAQVTPSLIATLSQRADIVQIRPDQRFQLEADVFTPEETSTTEDLVQWNLEMVQAPLAWQALGLDGTGVVVANMDTGVDWQHPALVKQYRGYNPDGPTSHVGNWFVATNEPYIYPGDGYGHGTHTMGTMVGDDGLENRTGIAPGARWIAAKIFDNAGFTYESWIHSGFEWMLAPDGDPALAPDIVNNSWGSPIGSDERFRPDVTALLAAGILPVFSAGNNGPFAGTVGSPGSYPESLAVGALDEFKVPATFSSRGPSPWGEIKPEISAPGVNIRSTYPGGGYAYSNGTSMAAPLVAGAAALLLQANPALTPAELEDILLSSAEPLGDEIPNNDTGWGLINTYAAALRLTSSGEVRGSVRSTDGTTIPFATITARTHPEIIPSRVLTISVSAQGEYLLALQPGRYEITAQAFGFSPQNLPSLIVLSDTQYTVNFELTPLPVGWVTGKVTDLDSGAPLAATLTVSGTPVQAQTEPADGSFELALPAGTWGIAIETDALAAHRTGHITPTLSAGQVITYQVALASAPSILLVDSGQWYYDSQAVYFAAALQDSNYPYHLWPIRHLGLAGDQDDRPTPDDLAPYDVVLWSDPLGSPGYIGVSTVISSYLGQSGHLLLSGQSIAQIDGGGDPFEISWYIYNQLGLYYQSTGQLTPLNGVPDGPLAGMQIALNTPDSAQQQTTVDAVSILSPLRTFPSLAWEDGSLGGVVSGICTPFRAAWLGFGLEGAGPEAVRTQTLDRLIEWMQSPPESYGLHLTYDPATMIGVPGQVISREIALNSTGVQTDAFTITVSGGSWPISVMLPDGSTFQDQGRLALPACSQEVITVTISIPPDEPFQSITQYTFDFSSENNTELTRSLTLTAKTPAPLLLVDYQRWYDHIQEYQAALENLVLPYDMLDGPALFSQPDPANILRRYPTVIWTAGYNWFDPLNSKGRDVLTRYLDNGGRLLISGQDILDTAGETPFVRDYLGVADFTLTVTTTEVQPVSNGILGDTMGLLSLAYPYNNWSDGIQPSPKAEIIVVDGSLYPSGVALDHSAWRTLFYAFPLESLEPAALRSIMLRSLAWLSPLGQSTLQAPDTAEAGSSIPVTLTLRLDGFAPLDDLYVTLSLPAEITPVPGSLGGAWSYLPAEHSLVWQGALSPHTPLAFSALLTIANGLPAGSTLPLQVSLLAADGNKVLMEHRISIDTPRLELSAWANTQFPQPGEIFTITLAISNSGVTTGFNEIMLSTPGLDPASLLLQEITGTLWISAGEQSWSVILPADTVYHRTYHAQIPEAVQRLAFRVDAADGYQHQMGGLVFEALFRSFSPLLYR